MRFWRRRTIEEMPLFSPSFDHIHIKTDETVACAQFLIDVLKGTLVGEAPMEPGKRITVAFGSTNILIDAADNDRTGGHQFIEHFAIKVDDLSAFAAHFTGLGHEFVKPPHQVRPGLDIAFIMAPGNVLIEVLQRR